MTDNPDQREQDSEERKEPLDMDDDELAADLFGEELRDKLKELARGFRPDDTE